MLLVRARILSVAPSSDLMKHLKREYAMGLLEDESDASRLSTRALEELLQERRFDPSDVRERILRGEAMATPSPVKKMRSAPLIASNIE